MDLQLTGRRALVTGGTRGIGLAIVQRLAEEGCEIAICARDGAVVAQTVAEFTKRGVSMIGEPVDVADAEALEGFVTRAAEQLGGLDLVVANAGGARGQATLAATGVAEWDETFTLNVRHAAVVTKAATPALSSSDAASVLMIASVSGSKPQPSSQYAAAKAAEIALAASLGRELGPTGIRVNTLSPGSILFEGGGWSRRRESDPEGFAAFERQEFPFGRLGTVDEIADVAAFLLSPRARWVNGTDVVVDGGQNAPMMGGY